MVIQSSTASIDDSAGPMSRRPLAAVLLFVLTIGPAAAQSGGDYAGFDVIRLEPSARSASLAGAFAAVADGDVDALFFNPAIPDPATNQHISFSYTKPPGGLNAGSVAYSRTPQGIGTTVSGGLRFLDGGVVEERPQTREPSGDFAASNSILTIGAARPYRNRLRYGGTVNFLHSRIDQARSSVLTTNLGVTYRIPGPRMVVAVTLHHVSITLDVFGPFDTRLPHDLQVGLSKRLAPLPLLITLTAYDLTNVRDDIDNGNTVDDVLEHVTVGAEFQPGDLIRIRVGYDHRRSRELGRTGAFDFAGFGIGFGALIADLTIDYAYKSWSSVGDLHQFTLRTDLGTGGEY